MIRIKVRSNDSRQKVLWFDQSVEFSVLLRKILYRLGVTHERDDGNIDLSELFLLKSEEEAIEVRDPSRIQYDDELVLERKKSLNDGDKPRAWVKTERSGVNVSNSSYAVKKEETDDSRMSVASYASKNDTASVKKDGVDDSEVISISSDDDDSSFADHEEEGDEEYDSSSSYHSYFAPRRNTNKRAKPNPKKEIEPPLEVIMNNRDIPSAPGKFDRESEYKSDVGIEEKSMLVNGAGKKKAEEEVKHRIIKLLNTGFHDQSNENEAKNAMKLAQRLMRKYNLSQALLLKEREIKNSESAQDDEVLKGGMVTVEIINRKTRKPSIYARWISQLGHPVCENFGVKHYNCRKQGKYLKVVFYGIYSNAQLAGYAFKVAVERISQMMVEFQPTKSWRNISTKSSRLSYAIGIVRGISDDVARNIRMEKEQRKRKLERARLAESKGEVYEESDDEDFDIDDNEGTGISLVKEEVRSSNNHASGEGLAPPSHSHSTPKQNRPISGIDLQNRVEELEKEEQAALVLVDHNAKVAEEVLKEQGIKLSTGRKRKPIQFDNHSYEKGIEDSREIDINQRALRDEVKVKVEKS